MEAALAMVKIVEVANTTTKEEFLKVINAHTIQILKVSNLSMQLRTNVNKYF